MSGDGWTVVGKDGKFSNAHNRAVSTDATAPRPFLGDCTDKDVCRRSISQLTDRLRHSGFCSSLKASLSKAEVDKEVIQHLGGSILQPEEATQHATTEKVLFYMPHCDAALYNEVLDSNWDMQQLGQLAFLGNSFSHMEDRWSMPTFKRRMGKPHRVIALVEHGLVREERLRGDAFAVNTAFNDTSLHWFALEALHGAPELFRPGTAMHGP